MTVPVSRVPAAGEQLRGIKSVTDTTLSRLGDEELLTEVLQRARSVLAADTAAVLMLDRAGGELVLVARSGLEEQLRAGTRLPLDRGFAARVVTVGEPLMLHAVDPSDLVNPVLAQHIHSLMGVPLVAAGKVIGVLCAGCAAPRRFTDGDLGLLQLASNRAATAVHSLLTRADAAAAAALQRSLLPAALPAVAGAELAARYVPGDGVVGGDWYDVFVLPSGELCLTIGDVAGSGLAAAVVMGRMRSVLRAYALETRDPAEVIARLDRKMQHFEPETMATVLYAVFDPALDAFHVSSAGHFPPVVACPGQPSVLADVASDLMIGVDAGAPRRVSTVKVPAGALLCFYTDGLIERPDRLLDDCLAGLCQAVSPGQPDEACSAVMTALVGKLPARDDIAMLMFRRLVGT